jgi:hypothetical protein
MPGMIISDLGLTIAKLNLAKQSQATTAIKLRTDIVTIPVDFDVDEDHSGTVYLLPMSRTVQDTIKSRYDSTSGLVLRQEGKPHESTLTYTRLGTFYTQIDYKVFGQDEATLLSKDLFGILQRNSQFSFDCRSRNTQRLE